MGLRNCEAIEFIVHIDDLIEVYGLRVFGMPILRRR